MRLDSSATIRVPLQAPVAGHDVRGLHVPVDETHRTGFGERVARPAKEPDDRPPSAEWLAARLAECRTAEAWTPERAHLRWEASAPRASFASRPGNPTGTALTPPTPNRS